MTHKFTVLLKSIPWMKFLLQFVTVLLILDIG